MRLPTLTVGLACFLLATCFDSSMGVIKLITGNIDTSNSPDLEADASLSSDGQSDVARQFFVEFSGPVKSANRVAVEEAASVKLATYLPDNAFKVFCTFEQAKAIKQMTDQGVNWVGQVQSIHKISPKLLSLRSKYGTGADIKIVGTVMEGSVEDLPTRVTEWSNEFNAGTGSSIQLSAPSQKRFTAIVSASNVDDAIQFLAQQPEIDWIEQKAEMRIPEPHRPHRPHAPGRLGGGV